jgi:hypothetical protein
MVTWCLGEMLLSCPRGWQNFINDLKLRVEHNETEGFSTEEINRELRLFRAKMYESGRNIFVEFSDESCYTLFVLKYGGQQ